MSAEKKTEDKANLLKPPFAGGSFLEDHILLQNKWALRVQFALYFATFTVAFVFYAYARPFSSWVPCGLTLGAQACYLLLTAVSYKRSGFRWIFLVDILCSLIVLALGIWFGVAYTENATLEQEIVGAIFLFALFIWACIWTKRFTDRKCPECVKRLKGLPKGTSAEEQELVADCTTKSESSI
jgi:hypothetical protein